MKMRVLIYLVGGSVLCATLASMTVDVLSRHVRTTMALSLVPVVTTNLCSGEQNQAKMILSMIKNLDTGVWDREGELRQEQAVVSGSNLVELRAFYVKCRNDDKVAKLDQAIRTYDNPKAALLAAVDLMNQGETSLAQTIVTTTGQQFSDYSGVKIVAAAVAKQNAN